MSHLLDMDPVSYNLSCRISASVECYMPTNPYGVIILASVGDTVGVNLHAQLV